VGVNNVTFVAPNEATFFDNFLIQTMNTVNGSNPVYFANTATTSGNILAPQVAASRDTVYYNMTGTLGAGATLTTDTVANVLAFLNSLTQGLQSPVFSGLSTPGVNWVGTSWQFRLINTSGAAFSWTLAGGTGFTTNGTMTVAQNTWRDFVVTITTATAGTIQSVGVGTQS
jgi:hypothetical protein